MDWTAVGDLVQKIGIMGLLAAALIGGYRRIWVWGYQLDEANKRAEKAERLVEKALSHNDTLGEGVVRAVKVAEKGTTE